jgi:hypothetical protein
MDKLKLNNKKVSALKFTNPPIVPGEVYIGKKATKKGAKNHTFKLFYIPPELLSEEDDYVWAAFVPIRTEGHLFRDGWYIPPSGNSTRMSINLVDMDLNWIEDNTSYIREKIERSYPEYISLTELEKLLRPIKFINWMKELPLSQNKETEIIKPPNREVDDFLYSPQLPDDDWWDDKNPLEGLFDGEVRY